MKHRIVLDTNIYASALMNHESNPGRILKKIIDQSNYEIVISEAILGEIQRVLSYPKVRKFIRGTDEDINRWIQAIGLIAHFVYPKVPDKIIVVDDPENDKFILAALEGKAKIIISGDSHLLRLKQYQNITINAPQEFIKSIS